MDLSYQITVLHGVADVCTVSRLWAPRRMLRGCFSTSTEFLHERLGSLVQNTMPWEVRFRAELSEYGVERLELARA
jgi:hypothetical protein